MIRIFLDGRLLVEPRRPEYGASGVLLHTKLNDSGSLKLTATPENPEYDAICPMVSELSVKDGAEEFWRGRVVSCADDNNRLRTVTAKGVLDYLQDTIVLPQTVTGTAGEQFRQLVQQHNAALPRSDSRKKLALGEITMTGVAEDTVIGSPQKTFAAIKNLVKACGGIVRVRYPDGTATVDYLASITDTCSQVIWEGVNLDSLTVTVDPSSVATAIYPLGKKTGDDYLLCSDANGGDPYVVDDDAVYQYGWIADGLTKTDLDTPEALVEAAKAELKDRLAAARSVSASAYDMADVGEAQERVEVGLNCRVVAPSRQIDELLQATEIKRYLYDRKKTKITLGRSTPAISTYVRRLV